MSHSPARILRPDRDVGENLIAVSSVCLSSSKAGLKKQRIHFLPKAVALTQKILNRRLDKILGDIPFGSIGPIPL